MSDFLDKWVVPMLEFELAVAIGLIAMVIPIALCIMLFDLLTENRRR